MSDAKEMQMLFDIEVEYQIDCDYLEDLQYRLRHEADVVKIAALVAEIKALEKQISEYRF